MVAAPAGEAQDAAAVEGCFDRSAGSRVSQRELGDRSRHGVATGLHAQTIDNTLYDAFGQRQVSTVFTQLNEYHLVMEVAPEFQRNPDALKSIYVRSAKRHGRCRSARFLILRR